MSNSGDEMSISCPVCNVGVMKLKRSKRISKHTNRQRAIMICDNCGRKEVF